MIDLHGFQIPYPLLLGGAVVGLTYGVLAVGLVLVFRTNGVVNFAHGQMGAFGAAVCGIVVVRYGVPYWLGALAAVVISASIGGVVEAGVVRRLRKAPRLMSVIATLGFAQVLLLAAAMLGSGKGSDAQFPEPAGMPSFTIGTFFFSQAHVAMLILIPLAVAAITVFLRASRFGLALRAASENPEAARMSGVFAARMSTLAWMIAGGLSGLTAILLLPTYGFQLAADFGPGMLLRALAAAVVARMTSLPVALLTGVVIGIVEQVLVWNQQLLAGTPLGGGGQTETLLFVAILVALLVQKRTGGRRETGAAWASVASPRPLPEAYQRIWSIRHMGTIAVVLAVVVALVIPVLSTNATAFTLSTIAAFTVLGLSLLVISGLSGQLSLGQFAFAGIGAAVAIHVSWSTGNDVLAMLCASAAGGAASLVVGLPAVRIRGLMLAVTTLSFGLATQAWLLGRPWMLGAEAEAHRFSVGGFVLDTGKRYYYLALVVMGGVFWLVRNLRRSSVGRTLVALRDNEDAARALTIPAVRRKLQAFAVSGAIAGLGGALYAYALPAVTSGTFSPDISIRLVAETVLGGISFLAGPLLGALYIFALPAFAPLDSTALAGTAVGWLLLVLYVPGGLASLGDSLRRRVADAIARRHGIDPAAASAQPAVTTDTMRTAIALRPRDDVVRDSGGAAAAPLLQARALSRRFGGVQAVDGVTLDVMQGETLGVIGPNGAGKTTLFELVSGFTRADSGAVVFGGRDITRLGPEQRARLGLVRSFQDAQLFPTLSVLDTVALATERMQPSRLHDALVGARDDESRRMRTARELVDLMGLGAFAHKGIRELSTGTRRITELCCLVAMQPRLLLLDEPSAGIAQRETEALGGLLEQVKRHLDTTLVVIEHDMPLIMGLSDRVVAMESGQVIAEGEPDAVRNDPRVVESYLGGDVRAIERSAGRLVPTVAAV